jgi:hypothetical protein
VQAAAETPLSGENDFIQVVQLVAKQIANLLVGDVALINKVINGVMVEKADRIRSIMQPNFCE